MPEGVNMTSIVLIPKKETPDDLKDFRPISLCNVVYKIVSKCLVNRLRPLLHDIIALNQSAFIPGRMITDNVIIAFECIHAIQSGNEHARNFCAYKLDLSKAYDRVEWNYLEGAMRKLGFSDKWINWIMQCVTTVSYQVNFNGVMQSPFKPTRGIRQGYPLSPYLFLFVANGLSTLLSKAVESRQVQALSICRRAPKILHLLFADDSLLFFQGNAEQARRIKDILQVYSGCTGLSGTLCSDEAKKLVQAELHIEKEAFEEKITWFAHSRGSYKEGQIPTYYSTFREENGRLE